MSGGSSAAPSRDIQVLFDAGTAVGLSDRQLLDRFDDRRDPAAEAAFEALVRRHGPMVLRVCHNARLDPDDAQDAFQATFLVLVRRCGAVKGLESLGGWLHGVACRVAARARVEAAKRRATEGHAALRVVEAVEPSEAVDIDRDELGPMVQEEVRRLPERYRAAVVLCYWEGLTQEQAAAQLGCPLGTVRSRLARARDLLRRRLMRRGAAPLAGIATPGLDVASVVPISASVPDSWVTATVKAVMNVAAGAGPATAGAASTSVGLLVQSVLRRMLLLKVKTTAICLSFIAIEAAGVILAAPLVGADRSPPAAARGHRADRKDARVPAPTAQAIGKKIQPVLRPLESYVVEPPDLLLVEVLEALPGRPISGERLVRPDGKISLGFYGDVYVAGLTVSEIKEKIVLHLRKYLQDDTLGLLEGDPETGEIKKDREGRIVVKDPRETDRVFVEVTAYNSKNYYVQGRVRSPDGFPITGNETVLDAINLAGGLTQQADHNNVVLYRPAPPGVDAPPQRLPVNIDQIMMGDDPTTNYQLLPGDRLVVHPKPGAGPEYEDTREDRPQAARAEGPHRTGSRTPEVRSGPPQDGAPGRDVDRDGRTMLELRDVERRLGEVERKLDRILDSLERRRP
jgi:RNA polymerase sigma factor (sigma-70 family)